MCARACLLVLILAATISVGCADDNGNGLNVRPTDTQSITSDELEGVDGIVALQVVPTDCPGSEDEEDGYDEVEACLARYGVTRNGEALLPDNTLGLSYTPVFAESYALAFVATKGVPNQVLRYGAIAVIVGANVVTIGVALHTVDWEDFGNHIRAFLTPSRSDTENERAWQSAIREALGIAPLLDDDDHHEAPPPYEPEGDPCAFLDDEFQYPSQVGPVSLPTFEGAPPPGPPQVTVTMCSNGGHLRMKPTYIEYELPEDAFLHYVDTAFVNVAASREPIEVRDADGAWMRIEPGYQFIRSVRLTGTQVPNASTLYVWDGWIIPIQAPHSGQAPWIEYVPSY